MSPDTPDLPDFDRGNMWASQDLLMNWRPTNDTRKSYHAPPADDQEGH
jgi:hypothetical protein